MSVKIHVYPVLIKEMYLDTFGHVNNAMYLSLFEEARWDLITKNGYGISKINETGLGPVLLEVNLRFIKELYLREEIVIESQLLFYKGKIGKTYQCMKRSAQICCIAEVKWGLFDLKARKLVSPTKDWLKAMDAPL